MVRWTGGQLLSTLLLGHRWLLRRVQIKLKDRVNARPRGKREDAGENKG